MSNKSVIWFLLLTSQVHASYTKPQSTNTANAVVKRDASGNFSAGIITATLTGTASGNATPTLNNLGATAVNASIIPDDDGFTGGTKDLGTAANGWRAIYASTLNSLDGSISVRVPDRQLTDSGSNASVNWEDRQLRDAGAQPTLDWNGGTVVLFGGADFNAFNAYNLADPVAAQDAATKVWSENLVNSAVTVTAQAIPATTINWATGFVFTKTLSANTTFTFSNQPSGKTIVVRLTNTASNYTVTWPGGVLWSGGVAPTQTIGAKSDVYTFVYDGATTYGSVVQDF